MIYILYENADWLPPLVRALDARDLSHTLHFCDGGWFDVQAPPPPGVWINRMSPSAHTRGHGDGVVYTREFLAVLEAAGRRVVNGSAAYALEVSKIRQHAALEAFGILTPRTLAVAGTRALKRAARRIDTPFITKHNQGGKGLGVRLFRDLDAFDAYVDGSDFEPAFDGVTLLQQYVEPPSQSITRVELVDGRFVYAITASTAGGFELCPSDACAADDAFCPVGDTGKFGLADIGAKDPLVRKYIAFCRAHGIDVAGIEFVTGADGRRYTYDINMNTNYNGEVERAHRLDGMSAIAGLCERELAKVRAAA